MKKNLNSGTKQIVFMFLALAAIFLIFATIAPNFLTWKNMNGILLATMINGVLAVGITFALIGGGIDLSVGTGMTFGSVMIAIYITRAHMAVPLAILCGLLTCAGYGLINGLGIAKIKIPPFIMTLGMMMVTKGLSLILTGSRPVYLNEYPGFCALATGSVIDSLIGVNLPNGFILLLILAAISHIILSRSTFGRYIYAIGSNEEATRLSGINVDKWKMLIYVTTGFFAGLAGLLMSSRLSSAQPALGSGYEMDAIAAAIIGGASTRGGEGTIIGTIVGAFIISVLTNGLRMMSVATEWQTVLTGVVVILAVCVALVLIGGVKRIASVSQVVVPFMAIIYVLFVAVLVIANITRVPAAFKVIVQAAFSPRAITGGAVGSMLVAMQKGVARGIFSNEAGLGSAPIAAAAAQTNEPVRQGLVSMTGTFIDTIVICTLTGLSIVITGAWQVEGIEGVAVTTYAFQNGLPFPAQVSSFVLMLCLVFFAFTTILGWDYYSERCLEYLSGGNMKHVKIYRWIYILAVFIGPYMTVSAVWTIADIFNGLMALPNMIALFALSGVVVKETKSFFERHNNEKL